MSNSSLPLLQGKLAFFFLLVLSFSGLASFRCLSLQWAGMFSVFSGWHGNSPLWGFLLGWGMSGFRSLCRSLCKEKGQNSQAEKLRDSARELGTDQ